MDKKDKISTSLRLQGLRACEAGSASLRAKRSNPDKWHEKATGLLHGSFLAVRNDVQQLYRPKGI